MTKYSEIIRNQRREMNIPWNENKVIPFEVEGKTIRTNYNCSEYPYWDGNYSDKINHKRCEFRQTDSELLDELIEKGYTYIRFVYTTTYVRGYHEIHALYK